MKTFFAYSRKHCGKGRKCWLSAFSPFPTMFSIAFLFSEMSALCSEGSVLRLHGLSFTKLWENIMGNGENAGNQQFLLFRKCIAIHKRKVLSFKPPSKCCMQMFSTWTS